MSKKILLKIVEDCRCKKLMRMPLDERLKLLDQLGVALQGMSKGIKAINAKLEALLATD